jgi:hypothetical protein
VADVEAIRAKFLLLSQSLDERRRRLWAASEAVGIGRGGIAAVRRATGLAYETVARGIQDLSRPDTLPLDRARETGGGRKRAEVLDPTLTKDLVSLLDPVSRGDPESPLRWTTKSTRRLARELRPRGHDVSHRRRDGGRPSR